MPFVSGLYFLIRKSRRTVNTQLRNTENAEINEGLIRFDIIFYVRMKDGVSQIIINLERHRKMNQQAIIS